MLESPDAFLTRLKPRRASDILLWGIAAFLVIFIVWAALTELDRSIRAIGRVIPSSELQIVSNLEGGIVNEIYVKAGDTVRQGQELLRLDPIQTKAEFESGESSLSSLEMRIRRLRAEVYGGEPIYSNLAGTISASQIRSERALFNARVAERSSRSRALQSRIRQSLSSVREAQANYIARVQARDARISELQTIRQLVDRGVEPRFSVERAQSAANIAASEAMGASETISRAQSAVSEATASLSQFQQEWRSQAATELALSEAELDAKRELTPALEDKLQRTTVRTPVRGRVNRVLVTTLGGIIAPGQPVVEIVPSEEALLIEAQVNPKDIATVKIDQRAQISITAFDRSVYGALSGRVVSISPDAVVNKENGEAFYIIRVRTNISDIDKKQMRSIRISPGMVAEVDLLGEKRTILQYLLTPFTKLRDTAFRE